MPAHAKSKTKGWILEQRHLEAGDITVYLAKDNIKMEFKKSGWCILAKPPAQEIYIFRTKEKTVWIGTIEQLSPASLLNPFMPPARRKGLPIIVVKHDQYYREDGKHQIVRLLGTGKQGNMHYNEYSTRTGVKTRSVFRTTPDIEAGALAARLLCRLYAIPELGSVPLYARTNSRNESYSAELEKNRDIRSVRVNTPDVRIGPLVAVQTMSARRAIIDESVFSVPVGYTRKKDILDVTYSKDQKRELKNLLDNIGFETKVGSKSRWQNKNSEDKHPK